MSEKQTKRKRRNLRAEGVFDEPFRPGPNITDLPDTREQRRKKTYRKKLIALQMKQTSPLEAMKERARWNKAFYPLFNAQAIKATNAALKEVENEEITA